MQHLRPGRHRRIPVQIACAGRRYEDWYTSNHVGYQISVAAAKTGELQASRLWRESSGETAGLRMTHCHQHNHKTAGSYIFVKDV